MISLVLIQSLNIPLMWSQFALQDLDIKNVQLEINIDLAFPFPTYNISAEENFENDSW